MGSAANAPRSRLATVPPFPGPGASAPPGAPRRGGSSMRHAAPTAARPSAPRRKKHARQPNRGTTHPATARLQPKPTGTPA